MKSNKLLKIILALLVVVGLAAGYLFYSLNSKPDVVIPEKTEEQQTPVEEKPVQTERDIWKENRAINSDYIGEIIFDSNLINKSFVQAKDVYDSNGNPYHFYTSDGKLVEDYENYTGNDVYIWTNWRDMSYDYNILGGSVFMDYRNELNDQNIIIYGHHFSESGGNDPERIKAFTPLEKLLKQDNYKANSKVKLVLNNETRYYELVGVYMFDVLDDNHLENLQYYRTEYNYDEFEDVRDENYYENYIKTLDSVKQYPTDAQLTTDDKTLTLQTCIAGYDNRYYEICVFKQVKVETYTD